MKKLFTSIITLMLFTVSLFAQLDTIVNNSIANYGVLVTGDELYFTTFSTLEKVDLTESNPTPSVVLSGLNEAFGLAIKGDELYFAEGAGNAIKKINITETNPIPSLVVSVSGPVGIQIDGDFLYISQTLFGKILRINVTESNPVLEDVLFLNGPRGVFADGNMLYSAHGSSVSVGDINQSSTTVNSFVTGLSFAYGLTKVGDELFFSDSGAGKISKLNVLDPNPTAEEVYLGNFGFNPRLMYHHNGTLYIASNDMITSLSLVPGNECTDAIDINNLFGGAVGEAQASSLYDNTSYISEASDPTTGHECFEDSMTELDRTMWYSFTGDGNKYQIRTIQCGAIDPGDMQAAIYSGECGSLVPVSCNEDEDYGQGLYNTFFEIETEDGVDYELMVDAFDGNVPNNSTFCLEVIRLATPGNECIDAIDINDLFGGAVGVTQTSSQYDNTNYTSEASDPTTGHECFEDSTTELDRTMWYSFTGDGNKYQIRTIQCGATDPGDMQAAIYSGECGSLVSVSCNEDEDYGQGLYNAFFEIETEDGVDYELMVDGFDGNVPNNSTFCLEVVQLEPNAVTNISQTSINVFPNPTTGLIQLQNVNADVVEVFDNTGRVVKTIAHTGNSLDISEMAAGFYFLKMYEGEVVYSAKVIKE